MVEISQQIDEVIKKVDGYLAERASLQNDMSEIETRMQLQKQEMLAKVAANILKQ